MRGASIALRWTRWSEVSVIPRIFAAALTVGALTIAAKLAVVGKDVLVARRFGTGADLDAFLVAALVPLFAVSVIAGSLQSALVPTYIRVRDNEGRAQADALLSGTMVWTIGLLALVALVIGAGSPWLLGWLGRSFAPEQLALSRRLLWILLPLVVLGGVSAAWTSVLNAGESFALAAAVPVISPVLVGVGLVALGGGARIYVLAFGLLAGTSIELVVLGRALSRRGVSVIPRWQGMSAPMRRVIGQYLPMAAGAFLASGTGVVDQAIAARLGEGNVSALSYGGKVVSFVLAIGNTAIGTVVLPYFSRMLAANDVAGVRHTLRTYLRLILLVSVPVTAILVALSGPIVRVAFERGAFTAGDAHRVAAVQALYLLQVPFTVATMLGVRLMAASLMIWHLTAIAVVNFALNAALDVVFARWLGAPGIALSTAVVNLGCCLMVYATLRARYRRPARA
jgi:putative peptidoglycan lipid II flippase